MNSSNKRITMNRKCHPVQGKMGIVAKKRSMIMFLYWVPKNAFREYIPLMRSNNMFPYCVPKNAFKEEVPLLRSQICVQRGRTQKCVQKYVPLLGTQNAFIYYVLLNCVPKMNSKNTFPIKFPKSVH